MKNYKVQDGCHNCKHVFLFIDFDCPFVTYCNIEKDRPLCGSVYLNEHFSKLEDDDDLDLIAKASNKWVHWSEKHRVKESGICDFFENGIKKDD